MKKNLILLLLSILTTSVVSAQCLAGLNKASSMEDNPIEQINSVFNFDYKITSNLEYKKDGQMSFFNMIYYVNTADGSMFFPKGLLSENGYDIADDNMRFDGTIWLANGQLVTYFLDINNNKKRAMTVTSSKTSTDRFMDQHIGMLTFFNDMADPEMIPDTPEPLPESFHWNGITQGYAGEIMGDDSEAYMTIYFDTKPTPIVTTFPKVGFLVGVIKDHRIEKCNRLAVFTKINTEGSDYIQEELLTITKESKTFNATAYKPFGLLKEITGGSGTDIQNMQAKMMEFQQKSMEIGRLIERLKKEQKQCRQIGGDTSCRDHYNELIKEKEQEGKRLQCEIAKAMGAGDMMEDCE